MFNSHRLQHDHQCMHTKGLPFRCLSLVLGLVSWIMLKIFHACLQMKLSITDLSLLLRWPDGGCLFTLTKLIPYCTFKKSVYKETDACKKNGNKCNSDFFFNAYSVCKCYPWQPYISFYHFIGLFSQDDAFDNCIYTVGAFADQAMCMDKNHL